MIKPVALTVIGLALVFVFTACSGADDQSQYQPSQPSSAAPPVVITPPSGSESQPEELPTFTEYPVGKLVVSQRREEYVDGEMVLEIPRMDLVEPVYSGTTDEVMMKGIGMFEYAQLPGLANSNTSLVGHRDIHGREFLMIHRLVEGDLMYLTYQGVKYTFEYMDTVITEDDDWDPIRVKEYACITLQSCDPIGISNKRIFVNGRLIATEQIEQQAEPAHATLNDGIPPSDLSADS